MDAVKFEVGDVVRRKDGKPLSNHSTSEEIVHIGPTPYNPFGPDFLWIGGMTYVDPDEVELATYEEQQQQSVVDEYQHKPGVKLDNGKVRMGLVLGDFASALYEISKVGTFGANKYTPHGWLSVPDGVARYSDALYRHLNAFQRGEELDKESGISHLSHFAWNALAVLELTLRSKENEE